MEFFSRAKVFRLKCGHRSKYLVADKDEETVRQSSDSSSTYARWAIELVEGKSNVIRLRSCQSWKYLAISEESFLLGMTGKKIVQRLRLDTDVEWEPIKEGPYIKLKSHVGTFLRANPGLPPWRNSITHDLQGHWTGSENMVLWIVDIVEIDYKSTGVTNKTTPEGVLRQTIDVPSMSSNVEKQKPTSSRSSSLSAEDSTFNDGSLTSVRSSGEFRRPSSRSSPMASDAVSRYFSTESTAEHPHPLEVEMAKQTIKELKSMDFYALLSSGREDKLEKAVDVLVADGKTSERGKMPGSLANLHEKLKAMKNDHDSASKELVECTTFSTRRFKIRAELKSDAAKAGKLKDLDIELSNKLLTAKAKRDELLKQLDEAENSIKDAENNLAEKGMEIEVLITEIEQKSNAYREIERKEKAWQVRKSEAERTLERVEEIWEKLKNLFSEIG